MAENSTRKTFFILALAFSLVVALIAFGAVAGLLAQWGIIRTFRMGPRALLRWGVGVAALGNLLTAVSPIRSTPVISFGMFPPSVILFLVFLTSTP